MGKCMNCNVTILDDTSVCPFCRQILHEDDTQTFVGNTYPYVIAAYEKVRLIGNIFLFASLVLETVLFAAAFLGEKNYTIPFVAGLILFYLNVLVRQTVLGKSGYLFKLVSSIVIAALVLEAIDLLTGDRGWSMAIAWPAGVVLLNIGIICLMIINRRNWQSYLMPQILSILLALVPTILLLLGRVKISTYILAALASSVFLFLGTLIIGDYRARTELKRRFHI